MQLRQTSCRVCFVHVKCEGKDKLTSVFLGLYFSGATRYCCIALNKRMSLVCKHGADPRSLASQTWRYALHMSLSHAALKRRGGSDSRTLIVICSFYCVCCWQFMLPLRQITAQGVTALVTVGFLRACCKLNCLLTALVLQHLPCMSDSFCNLFECGLGRFSRCVKT